LGRRKLAWLNTLNISRRTWTSTSLGSLKRREMAVSTVLTPGPVRMLRPALPNVPAAGEAKAAVLNQRSGERSPPSRPGSPTRFGRWLPRLPMPATSELITGVKGEPLVSVKMALTCRRARGSCRS
jgi:hypothetical protein